MKNEAKRSLREHCLKFLYKCDSEKIYFYSDIHMVNYLEYFGVAKELGQEIQTYCREIMDSMAALDRDIAALARRWSSDRMLTTDRIILRLGAYELSHTKVPTGVILNEAVELAKLYGTEQSSKFINGVLDKFAKKIRS